MRIKNTSISAFPYRQYEYYTKVQNEKVYCTKLVKPGERTQRMSSPGLTKLSAIHCFVLHQSVVYLYYMPVFMQFGSVLGACNTTENIGQCYRPMKTLNFTSVCNKGNTNVCVKSIIIQSH